MSLKARLEAVIYAAEEPVTLAQLASLFAAEAFEWKAQQEAARTAAAPEENPQPLLGEAAESAGMDPLGLEQSPAIYSGSEPERAGAVEETAAPPPESAEAAPEAGTLDAETEARRQARLRDREVRGILRQILNELIASYASDDRGIEMREIAGGYRMATKPECHDAVRLFIKSQKPPLKLSLPALETLAVIAYKQPVTAPEVNEIRGVESGGVLGSLLSRKLIATAGRKQVIGRPILYKTTKEFLLRFGLKDISELPSMEEFEKMAAIELAEPTAEEVAEESVGAPPEGQPDLDEDAPEDESAETAEVPAEPQAADAAAGEVPAETETAHHEG